MERIRRSFPIPTDRVNELKMQMLNWVSRFGIFLCLDSNDYPDPYGRYDFLAGAGAAGVIRDISGLTVHPGEWLFGHLSYRYKDRLFHNMQSRLRPFHEFPDCHFFIPETVLCLPRGSSELIVETMGDPQRVYEEILATAVGQDPLPQITFTPVQDREDYLKALSDIRGHLRDGDCYELNYCRECRATGVRLDPVAAFQQLNQKNPAPFAAFYRLHELYALCASPERYLSKTGGRLLSQPMKGTARRSPDPAADAALRQALLNDPKERAENLMITDLVRNDLARSCLPGSIRVEELLGVYSFPAVHQLISTVSGKLEAGLGDAISRSFPMGSMTGAPKEMVLQLIDRYEASSRHLFSGSLGYISPDGDADFNVVIRSLFYDRLQQTLSFQSGGAITYDSDPEAEFEEVLLKARAMEQLFA